MIKETMIKGTITLNGNKPNQDTPDGNTAIDLINGSIVLHFSKNRKKLLGSYLVTSFRDDKQKYTGQITANYCSLINLETGHLKFEERCSRNTTMARVISHLSPGDYKGEYALKRGEFIEVYRRDKYTIDLSFNECDNEGWRNE